MTQEQVRQLDHRSEILDKTADLDETVNILYRQVEEKVEVMDPVRVDDILTKVLITEKPQRADIYGEDEKVNGTRRQILDSFYNDYINWKWSSFLDHHKTSGISLRKKEVISAIAKMDKPDGNSAVFNRFVWVAFAREVIKAVDSDARVTQAEGENNTGVKLVQAGEFEEAIDHFDQAIRLSRQFCMPLVNKGIALVNLGRFREAVDCFRLTVATDPNFKIAWFNLACAYQKTGDFNYARIAVRRALAIDPEYEAAAKLAQEIRTFRSAR